MFSWWTWIPIFLVFVLFRRLVIRKTCFIPIFKLPYVSNTVCNSTFVVQNPVGNRFYAHMLRRSRELKFMLIVYLEEYSFIWLFICEIEKVRRIQGENGKIERYKFFLALFVKSAIYQIFAWNKMNKIRLFFSDSIPKPQISTYFSYRMNLGIKKPSDSFKLIRVFHGFPNPILINTFYPRK